MQVIQRLTIIMWIKTLKFFSNTWTTQHTLKVKCSRYRPGVAQRVGRSIALPFHDQSTRRGWVVSSTPWLHFNPGNDPVPILQEAGWAPGLVWMGGKSRPHQDSILDRPACSHSLYRLSYPAHQYTLTTQKYIIFFFLQHLFFTMMWRLRLVSITLVSGKYQQNKKLEMTNKTLLGWGPERSMLHLHAFDIQGTMLQQNRNFPFVTYITLKKPWICNTVYLLQQGFLARRRHPSSHMKYHF